MTAAQRATTPVPASVEFFPEFAAAALKAKQEKLLVAWVILHQADTNGSGQLNRAQANSELQTRLAIGARQARRILREGSGRFWRADGERIFLAGALALSLALGITRVSRPHLVPLDDVQRGGARRRAALAATLYRTDASGTPISRRQVEALNGLSATTQRRYEAHGHAHVVQQVHTWLTHIPNPATKTAYAQSGDGFYQGRGGDLMRRHADVRQATRHRPGSGAKARRLNAQLAKLAWRDSPVTKAHGERSRRAFFPARGRQASGHQAWMKTPQALGRPGHEATMTDARFDYGTVEVRGRRGRMRYESVTLPEEPDIPSGPDLAGSVGAEEQTPLTDSISSAAHSPPNDVRAPDDES